MPAALLLIRRALDVDGEPGRGPCPGGTVADLAHWRGAGLTMFHHAAGTLPLAGRNFMAARTPFQRREPLPVRTSGSGSEPS
jgi:hypothetical protein